MKLKTSLFCISVVLLISLFSISGCFLLPISEKERTEIYSYFSKDDNYVEVYGKLIRNNTNLRAGVTWFIMFDEEYISGNQGLYNRWFAGKNPQGVGCEIINQNYTILLENRFYDMMLDESEIEESAEYPALIEETIYVVTSYRAWTGAGVSRPAVEVRVGDTVYLDFETGKANFLDWIQNDLR